MHPATPRFARPQLQERNREFVGTSTNWSAICGAPRTVRAPRGGHTICGHFDNLLGNTDIERCEKVHQLFHHLRLNIVEQRDRPALGRRSASQCAAEAAPAAAHPRETAADPHPPHRSPRTSRRTPSPPWQCSGSVERCATRTQHSLAQSGAGQLQGPSRSTPARDATEHAAVAPAQHNTAHTTTPQPHHNHTTTHHNHTTTTTTTTQHNNTQPHIQQHNTAQHSTTQHNTTQHNTAQHSTAQNTPHRSKEKRRRDERDEERQR